MPFTCLNSVVQYLAKHGWIRLLLQFHNSINAVIESGDFGHSSLEVQVAIHQQVKTLLKPAPSLWLTCNFTTVDGSEILQCIKPIENNGRYTTLVWWFQSIWKICSSKWVHLPQSFRVKIKKYLSCHHPAVPHIKWCLPDGWTINVVCQPMGWKARTPPRGASSSASDRLDPDDGDRFIGDPLIVAQVQCILWNPYTRKQP